MVAALSAAAGCDYGRGGSQEVQFAQVDNVTYLGCVGTDRSAEDRLLLWTIDDPAAASAGPSQSTSTYGAWVGTRQVEVTGAQREAIARLSGQRIRATGTLEAQTGGTGNTDQLQHAHGVAFRRLNVSAFEPAAGSCSRGAVDAEPQETRPHGQ